MKRAVICACLFLLFATPAFAEKVVYVVDQITITLRAGQGTQHQILRTLPSGTPLEVLQNNEDTGYTQVRTKDGVEGWVLSQYLIDEPTSKIKLTAAEQKLTRLDNENKDLKTKVDALAKEKEQWDAERKSIAAEREKLASEMEKLRQSKPQDVEPDAEKPPVISIEKEVEMLRQENQVLKDRTKKDWFLAGAGIMLIGIIAGLVASRFRLRRSGWGDSL